MVDEEVAFVRCTSPLAYYDSKMCKYPNCTCQRVSKREAELIEATAISGSKIGHKDESLRS